MTHQEIEASDISGRYVRGTLDPATREAFEEHFFACDECFASVRDAERLRAAVFHGAHGDAPPAVAEPAPVRPALSALVWLPMAATVVLGVGLSWVLLQTVPHLRSEVAAVRADCAALASRPATEVPVPAAPVAEANVPIVMLQSERDAAAQMPTALIPSVASHLVIWMSAPAAAAPVHLLILASDGREVTRVNGVRRNSDGAYVVSLPAALVPPQTYRLRLVAGDGPSSLIGEYVVRLIGSK